MTNERDPRTDKYRLTDRDLLEASPSGDYRTVCAALGVDPDGVHVDREVSR